MSLSDVSFSTPIKNYSFSSQSSLNSSQDSTLGSKLDLSGYSTSPATTPVGRDNKAGWYAMHQQHKVMCGRSSTQYILLGDSIIAGLSRYAKIWRTFFEPLRAINCGIGGDRTQHVLWRAEHLEIPAGAKFVVIHCGTNNIDRDSPSCIANGILSIAVTLQEKTQNLNILVTGLLPRDLHDSFRREKIHKVNKIMKRMCKTKFTGIHYMKQEDSWTLSGGLLDESLYHTDHLHLIEKGNEKFATSIKDTLEKLEESGKIDYSSDEESGSEVDYDYHKQVSEKRKRRRHKDSDDEDHHSSRSHKKSHRSSDYHYSSSSSSSRNSKHRRSSSPRRKERSEEVPSSNYKWEASRKHGLDKLSEEKSNKKSEEENSKEEKPNEEEPKKIDKGPLLGTAKSIDITLDERKRIEARRSKFACPKNPSALVQKIMASQKEARKDLNMQRQKSKDGATPDLKVKKLFSDYTADSDSE